MKRPHALHISKARTANQQRYAASVNKRTYRGPAPKGCMPTRMPPDSWWAKDLTREEFDLAVASAEQRMNAVSTVYRRPEGR